MTNIFDRRRVGSDEITPAKRQSVMADTSHERQV